MKKRLITLITIILCLFLVTGCGLQNDAEENIETTNNNTAEAAETNTSTESEKIELYSDNTKIVFKNASGSLVFYYSGEKITKYEAYLDYQTPALAQYALSLIEKDNSTIKKASANGRYVVIEYNESEYENLTVSEVRALYSYLEESQK